MAFVNSRNAVENSFRIIYARPRIMYPSAKVGSAATVASAALRAAAPSPILIRRMASAACLLAVVRSPARRPACWSNG